MIKLNDYLEFFPVPDGITATKIAREEFVDVPEDGVPYQGKLEFKKEGFDLRSSTLKEFLAICMCLEEAELQKPLKKKIVRAIKEHDNLDNRNPSRVTRHVRVRASVTGSVFCVSKANTMEENKGRNIETRSAYAPYCRTADALAGPVC
eukprot:10188767-Ditylum_brightwellii.AAC.1